MHFINHNLLLHIINYLSYQSFEMNLGPRYNEVVSLPPQTLAALFYLPLKMPLAVDESLGHIVSSCKLFSVQPWLQAQIVSAVLPYA